MNAKDRGVARKRSAPPSKSLEKRSTATVPVAREIPDGSFGPGTKSRRSKGVASQKLRFAVLTRDNFTCRYCGATPPAKLEVDHADSVANGGKDEIENYVTCCIDCNRGKGKASAVAPSTSAVTATPADAARIASLVAASTLPTMVAREILAERIISMQDVARSVRAKGREVSNDQLKALAAIERAIQQALELLGVVAPAPAKNPFADLNDPVDPPAPGGAPAPKKRTLDDALQLGD